jgi:tetratricopeptide (TPR) repeat protein
MGQLHLKHLDKVLASSILILALSLNKMDVDLAQKAVSAALEANWKEAVTLNQQILKESPEDIDALNRLSRAYAELGNIKKAKQISERVLKFDPFNSIAAKALSKWKGARAKATTTALTPADAFLEEPGKTKMLSLIHLGDAKVTSKLAAGEVVEFTPHSHRVSVLTQDGKYLGRLPDDISARLRKLIASGYQYKVLVKSTNPGEVKVFIREMARPENHAESPSFPAEKIDYISFTPPELVHKKEALVGVSEEE